MFIMELFLTLSIFQSQCFNFYQSILNSTIDQYRRVNHAITWFTLHGLDDVFVVQVCMVFFLFFLTGHCVLHQRKKVKKSISGSRQEPEMLYKLLCSQLTHRQLCVLMSLSPSLYLPIAQEDPCSGQSSSSVSVSDLQTSSSLSLQIIQI